MTRFPRMQRAIVPIMSLALLAGVFVLLRFLGGSLSPALVRDALQRLDTRGGGFPIPEVALVVLLAGILVVPVVPASILQIGSGLAFGPAWGLVYALLADGLGAAAGFMLARHWGRRVLGRWLNPQRLGRVEGLARRLTWRGVILLRLLPGPAYPLVSFAAGLSRLSLRRYLLSSLAGVLPSLALLVYAGDIAATSPLLAAAIVAALVASLGVAGRLIRGEQADVPGQDRDL